MVFMVFYCMIPIARNVDFKRLFPFVLMAQKIAKMLGIKAY